MAKGYQANRERLEEVSSLGKAVGKRAGFRCEWCGSRDEPRLWDHRPDVNPTVETLVLLCRRCRGWAEGGKAEANDLRSIRDALWSDIPSVSEGAARVLVQCREAWVREAVEESLIADAAKAELLK